MKQIINNILKAFITIISFFINLEVIYKNNINSSNIFIIGLLPLLIMFIFFYLFYKNKKNNKLDIYMNLFALLLSIFMIIGNSYYKINSWNLVFGNYIMIFISIISLFGYFSFFSTAIIYLNNYFENKKFNIKLPNKIENMLNEKPFICSLIVILICWLIYIIAFYPIILSPDPSYQIKQFFNLDTKYSEGVILINQSVRMTNHHPVLHTILLGCCLSIGRFLGSDNLGLFIYSAIQLLFLAITLAYTIKYLKKLNLSNLYLFIILLIYSLVPMFPLYAMSGVKDVIFTTLMIWYVLLLFDLSFFYNDKKISISKLCILLLVLLLISMFRNNGLYVILLSFPFLIFVMKNNRMRLTMVLIIYFLGFKCYGSIILPSFGITNGSVREILSIPFQQTARYANEKAEDLTKDDIKVIDKVLDYQDLATRYDPEFADPVKNKYNKYTTNDELKEYFKVWFKGLKKHPNIYIESTLNNIYGYFYPNKTNWYIYYKFDKRITMDNLTNYHYNGLNKTRNILSNYGKIFPYIPVLGLISNIGFNTWILLYLFLKILKINKRYAIYILPLLISLLVCVASPVNAYFRYAMPYIFSMPLAIGIYIFIKKGGHYAR